jgi:hypothetical protein
MHQKNRLTFARTLDSVKRQAGRNLILVMDQSVRLGKLHRLPSHHDSISMT